MVRFAVSIWCAPLCCAVSPGSFGNAVRRFKTAAARSGLAGAILLAAIASPASARAASSPQLAEHGSLCVSAHISAGAETAELSDRAAYKARALAAEILRRRSTNVEDRRDPNNDRAIISTDECRSKPGSLTVTIEGDFDKATDSYRMSISGHHRQRAISRQGASIWGAKFYKINPCPERDDPSCGRKERMRAAFDQDVQTLVRRWMAGVNIQ